MQPSSALRPGDVVGGRYRVESVLGQGGFGIVYRAAQVNMGRPVALKMIRSDVALPPDALARFEREAQLAQRLEHPNTVRLIDFGRTEAGLPFMVWELLEGEPLDRVLRTQGRLGLPRALRIGSHALKSLMEAHALGIVHRDIKPSNVFLCRFSSGDGDFVKLIDFGIAKTPRSRSQAPMTEAGLTMGTPSYMAPEQVSGEELTPAADLYALGLVLAEVISGYPVMRGASAMAVCMAQLSDAPVPLPPEVVQSPLGPVIVRATQKKAHLRYPSAAAMLADIDAVAAGSTASSAPAYASARAAPEAYSSTAFVAPQAPSGAFGNAQTAFVPQAAALAPIAPSWPSTAATPATYVAPPPPPARKGRGLLVVIAVLGALVAASTTIAILAATGAIRFSAVDPKSPGQGTVVGGHFAALTNKQMRARIEAAGYLVTSETPSSVASTRITTWNIRSVSEGIGQVQLQHLPDPISAAIVKETCDDAGGAAMDGNNVLCVMLEASDAQAKRLAARLVK